MTSSTFDYFIEDQILLCNACIAEETAQDFQKNFMDNQDHVMEEDVNVDDAFIFNNNITQHKVEGDSDHPGAMMSSDKFHNRDNSFVDGSLNDEELHKKCRRRRENGKDTVLDSKDEMDLFFHDEGEHIERIF